MRPNLHGDLGVGEGGACCNECGARQLDEWVRGRRLMGLTLESRGYVSTTWFCASCLDAAASFARAPRSTFIRDGAP